MKRLLTAAAAAACLAAVVSVPAARAATADPVIAAAGNIACDPANPAYNGGAGTSSACREMATSDLLVNQGYAAVLPLGDNQYEDGSAAKFQQVYDPSWGRVKTLSHPVPGNHDYQTAGASGYYGYFGSSAGAAGQGYYSYDVGAWHLIALNSNCTQVSGGCAAGSPQETWLRQDLAAHANTCVLAYWHHPTFSSGEDGFNPVTSAFWQDLYAYGADVVLDGHAHEYERFAPQNPQGAVDSTYGLTEFVDGTGGEGFEPTAPRAANSVVLRDGVFGILQLTLHSAGADFRFVDAAGAFSDSGAVNCHGAPPATGPASPTGVDGTTGNGQVTASWTPVSGQVSSYTVTASPVSGTAAGATVTVPGSAATAVVPGLANGTAYTFVVTATNSAGSSLPSAASRPITPVAPPGDGTYVSQVLQDAPAGFWRLDETSTGAPAADASGNGRTGAYANGVTLGQPGATAGGTAAAYDGSGGATTIPDATPLRLNGAFTIEFWAKMTSFVNSWPGVLRKGAAGTADGYVVWYTSAGTVHFKRGNLDIATPAGELVTSAYRHFALVDNGSTATWYVNGSAVSSGQLAASLSAGTDPLILGQGDQSGRQVLDDVAVYNSALSAARIAAHVNAAPVTPSAPATAPSSPTSVTATAGNAAATVHWTAPASNGGSPITGYTVTSNTGATVSAGASATSAVVTGLTNGTSYTFTVSATNSVGTSPPSTSSNAVVPMATPDPPTSVSATAGNASATVSWSPPASNGGSAITSYTVRSNSGATATVDGNTLSTTVTGLTNGTSYTFTVTATSAAGTSAASAPSNAVVPATVPGAPTGVTATAGNAAATVSWTAPVSNGGNTITSYTVVASNGATITVSGSPVTITGLTNGTSYTFTVSATNGVGTGAASAPSNAVVPAAVPDPPTGVSAVAGNASATVSWSAPASSGGSAITSYTVRSGSAVVATVDGNTLSTTVTGLTNGTSYTFTVTATNAAGSSPASAPSNAVIPATAPGAPTGVTATAGDTTATVTWSAPSSNGGNAISSYTVTASNGATVTIGASTTSTTFAGLTNGTAYTFTVAATNSVGTGASSAASNAVTPSAAPAYASTVMGDQPFAYWRLGETSGTTAADSSGHNVNGAYTSGVTLGQPGALSSDSNRAALFNGTTGTVDIPDSAAVRLNGAFTIEFWAKQKTFANSWPGLMMKGPSATANGYLIWYTSSGTLHFKRNNVDLATPVGAFSSTAWHLYDVSYDGATLRWYVDGTSVSSRTVTFPANAGTAPLQLGRGDQYGNEYLDEVALYATALTPTRVGAHYAAA